MLNPDRISVGGFCGYDEVINTPDDDGGGTEEGSEIKRGIGSPFGSDVGFCFCAVVLVEWCILYLGFPFAGVIAGGGVGIGTGVAVLGVSGTGQGRRDDGSRHRERIERRLGICAQFGTLLYFSELESGGKRVSFLSLNSLGGDSARDDGCDREQDGESTGVGGVLER